MRGHSNRELQEDLNWDSRRHSNQELREDSVRKLQVGRNWDSRGHSTRELREHSNRELRLDLTRRLRRLLYPNMVSTQSACRDARLQTSASHHHRLSWTDSDSDSCSRPAPTNTVSTLATKMRPARRSRIPARAEADRVSGSAGCRATAGRGVKHAEAWSACGLS